MSSAPRFLSFYGKFKSVRETGELLEGIFDLDFSDKFISNQSFKSCFEVSPDDENDFGKSCFDSIKNGVFQ